jgi:excinuclease ABC subunit B
LDADKEGFLRNHRSLVQTIGRAARNDHGHVIMYADKVTDSMRAALDETARRRRIQMEFNEAHGIVPQTVHKKIGSIMDDIMGDVAGKTSEEVNLELAELSRGEVTRMLESLEGDMQRAAAAMDFEEAARLRDEIVRLRVASEDVEGEDVLRELKKTARKGSAFGNRKNAAYGSARRS